MARALSLTPPAGGGTVTERHAYDAAGRRVRREHAGGTTVYAAGGRWEETVGGARRAVYTLQGRAVAQRDSATNQVLYLHGDHLGSVSVVTDQAGTVVSRQQYDPWGAPRGGEGIGERETTLDFTGQRRDGTGLLFYNARYYDPQVGRFLSPDSVVPGKASGKGGAKASMGAGQPGGKNRGGADQMSCACDAETAAAPGSVALGWDEEGVELRPLTVAFHEPQFVSALGAEHRFTQEKGFWFQLRDEARQEAKYQWGPRNPQALNRYAYVLNNPLRYTDPTGHEEWIEGGGSDSGAADVFWECVGAAIEAVAFRFGGEAIEGLGAYVIGRAGFTAGSIIDGARDDMVGFTLGVASTLLSIAAMAFPPLSGLATAAAVASLGWSVRSCVIAVIEAGSSGGGGGGGSGGGGGGDPGLTPFSFMGG